MPISAMLIFSVGSQAAASTRITETLVGAAAGLAAGLVFAPMRVQPAKEAVGELSRQMADLLSQMAEGLAEAPDPKRAAEWLDRTRALRGEIERVDDALAQAEESVRLNPRRLRSATRRPACGTASTRWSGPRRTCGCWPVRWPTARGSTASTARSRRPRPGPGWPPSSAELSAAVRAYGQLLEADPVSPEHAAFAAEPITEALEDHLEEAAAAAGPARRPALHQPGRTAGGLAAARRDPVPRGPAALRTRALAPAGASPGQAAAADPAAEGAARTAGAAPERAARQRMAQGSGGGGFAAALRRRIRRRPGRGGGRTGPPCGCGPGGPRPGRGPGGPDRAASRGGRHASAARRAPGARCRGSRVRSG